MKQIICPGCGSLDSLRVTHLPHFLVECKHGDCFWSRRPDNDLIMVAALETEMREKQYAVRARFIELLQEVAK